MDIQFPFEFTFEILVPAFTPYDFLQVDRETDESYVGHLTVVFAEHVSYYEKPPVVLNGVGDTWGSGGFDTFHTQGGGSGISEEI